MKIGGVNGNKIVRKEIHRMEQLTEFNNAILKFGVAASRASEAIREFATHIPPFTEDDIL